MTIDYTNGDALLDGTGNLRFLSLLGSNLTTPSIEYMMTVKLGVSGAVGPVPNATPQVNFTITGGGAFDLGGAGDPDPIEIPTNGLRYVSPVRLIGDVIPIARQFSVFRANNPLIYIFFLETRASKLAPVQYNFRPKNPLFEPKTTSGDTP